MDVRKGHDRQLMGMAALWAPKGALWTKDRAANRAREIRAAGSYTKLMIIVLQIQIHP